MCAQSLSVLFEIFVDSISRPTSHTVSLWLTRRNLLPEQLVLPCHHPTRCACSMAAVEKPSVAWWHSKWERLQSVDKYDRCAWLAQPFTRTAWLSQYRVRQSADLYILGLQSVCDRHCAPNWNLWGEFQTSWCSLPSSTAWWDSCHTTNNVKFLILQYKLPHTQRQQRADQGQ